MDLGLRNLKAVVTGGTKGIGRAIAETLASEGADVAICARNAAEVKSAVAALKAKGVNASGSALDVADGPALKAWIGSVGKELGGIDIIVANVSALAVGGDEESWRKGFAIDMMGAVNMVGAAMPYLEKSRHAAIVTISSVSGREIDFAAGPYGAFKAALIHYTQGLAFQLAGKDKESETSAPVPSSVNRQVMRMNSRACRRLPVTLLRGMVKLNHQPDDNVPGPKTMFEPQSQVPLSKRPPLWLVIRQVIFRLRVAVEPVPLKKEKLLSQ